MKIFEDVLDILIFHFAYFQHALDTSMIHNQITKWVMDEWLNFAERVQYDVE